jgi:signal transduction histidine kinase
MIAPLLLQLPKSIIAPLRLKLSPRRQGMMIVAIPITCLLATLAVMGWLKANLIEDKEWVEHTQNVRLEAQYLLTNLVDAETGFRGYNLTNNLWFLETYQTAIAPVKASQERLQNLVADNPQQQQRVLQIKALTNKQLELLANNLNTVNLEETDRNKNQNNVWLESKSIMDETREKIDIFLKEEERLFQKRSQHLNQQQKIIDLVMWLGAIIGIIAGLVAMYLFFRLYHRLQASVANAQLQSQKLQVALEDLKQAQTQLIHSEKMSSLGQLVAGIAHEINNPLTFIHGNIQHLTTYVGEIQEIVNLYQKCYPQRPKLIAEYCDEIDLDFVNKDLEQLTKSILNGTERISKIVLGLRNFSRLDESEKKAVNLHEGIDNALLILDYRLQGPGTGKPIQVVKKYGDLPLLDCYAGEINQVFVNLLNNAIDAIESQEKPGIITIKTELINPSSEAQKIKVSIADTGSGISEALQKHIFDPFFTTKPVGKGTGLGLSISYQIIAGHGGTINCVSSVGNGAEFCLELPLN